MKRRNNLQNPGNDDDIKMEYAPANGSFQSRNLMFVFPQNAENFLHS